MMRYEDDRNQAEGILATTALLPNVIHPVCLVLGGGCVCTNERAHIHLTRVVLSLLLGHWQPGRTLLSPLPCLKGPCQPLPRILCLLLSLFLLRETYFIEAGPLHNTKNHREVGPLKAHTSSYPRIGSFLPPEIGMW